MMAIYLKVISSNIFNNIFLIIRWKDNTIQNQNDKIKLFYKKHTHKKRSNIKNSKNIFLAFNGQGQLIK